jgi:hypothetical protein
MRQGEREPGGRVTAPERLVVAALVEAEDVLHVPSSASGAATRRSGDS